MVRLSPRARSLCARAAVCLCVTPPPAVALRPGGRLFLLWAPVGPRAASFGFAGAPVGPRAASSGFAGAPAGPRAASSGFAGAPAGPRAASSGFAGAPVGQIPPALPIFALCEYVANGRSRGTPGRPRGGWQRAAEGGNDRGAVGALACSAPALGPYKPNSATHRAIASAWARCRTSGSEPPFVCVIPRGNLALSDIS